MSLSLGLLQSKTTLCFVVQKLFVAVSSHWDKSRLERITSADFLSTLWT